jgi:hypothetical protein
MLVRNFFDKPIRPLPTVGGFFVTQLPRVDPEFLPEFLLLWSKICRLFGLGHADFTQRRNGRGFRQGTRFGYGFLEGIP